MFFLKTARYKNQLFLSLSDAKNYSVLLKNNMCTTYTPIDRVSM